MRQSAKITLLVSLGLAGGFAMGAGFQEHRDHAAIVTAQQNEAQANGLEDECKFYLNAEK